MQGRIISSTWDSVSHVVDTGKVGIQHSWNALGNFNLQGIGIC